ncbi:hypothetical protein MNBD_GAMMA11-528 [hydrothermal vent metagenome]|uniref:Uncharacterized protein n=1 Tax=hydrothermal vent metagenome TaxID=652676 RepID=A0A3B0WWC8_9ZZZZ
MNQAQATHQSIPLQVQVLEQISHLPLQLNGVLYQHYPAMKLGQKQAIKFYSTQLAVIAENIYQQEEQLDWVITAPPCHYLPAGANLLARSVHQLLAKQGITTELVEPRLKQQQVSFNSKTEFQNFYNYSKSTLEQRIKQRKNELDTLKNNKQANHLKNKSLIIINDINVTGTQQRFMQQALEQCQVKSCNWLYIFNIESSLAKQHPELEHQINHSRIKSLKSFSQVLSDPQTEHTSRCISRLFNEDDEEFNYLINHLAVDKRQQIHQLATQEGRYSGTFFEQKMQRLGSNK